MRWLNIWLDRITMYRLLLYYLIALVVLADGLSLLGYLQFNATALAFSAGYITIICLITNSIFARVFEAPTNIESVYITALILTLIVNPLKTPHDLIFLTAVSGLAIASKFVLAIRKKHIFNPAAIAVVLTALGPGQTASWWVGSAVMLPAVVIGGLLIVYKIQRVRMVLCFLAVATLATVATSFFSHHNITATLQGELLHSSLFFLAFVMLTEPLTSPATKNRQLWYAALVGILFPPQIHILSLYTTPELALVTGNVFSYVISPKLKLVPKLLKKVRTAPDTVDFIFAKEGNVTYKPGQYMEWTLSHSNADSRGNRRHFTLASSPTEDNLRIGVKFYPNGSTYKQAMLNMKSNTLIAAGQLGGDFILPSDTRQRLVFIAGGIGITPYRSMLKYLIDTNSRRDVTLFYSEKNPKAFMYTNIFDQAEQQLDAKVIYTVTDPKVVPPNWLGQTGYISAKMIKQEVPNYTNCLFYISGPYSMVTNMKNVLHHLGVSQSQIKTDSFSGYS